MADETIHIPAVKLFALVGVGLTTAVLCSAVGLGEAAVGVG